MIIFIPLLIWIATGSFIWGVITFCVIWMIEDLTKKDGK